IFADCSTNNVGISAVWSAFVGFIFLGWWRVRHLHLRLPYAETSPRKGQGGADRAITSLAMSTSFAIPASLAVWIGVCLYYAVVEEAMTTIAHLVAFGVGAASLLLFESLHQIPRHSS
ncbi:unnamed protein product, partial [Hapterophycus canaliculatus]